jgi:hypothetical protein
MVLYSYAGGNPATLDDPMGLDSAWFLEKLFLKCLFLPVRCCEGGVAPDCGDEEGDYKRKQCCTQGLRCCTAWTCLWEAFMLQGAALRALETVRSKTPLEVPGIEPEKYEWDPPPGTKVARGMSGMPRQKPRSRGVQTWYSPGWVCHECQQAVEQEMKKSGSDSMTCFRYSLGTTRSITKGEWHQWGDIWLMCQPPRIAHMVDVWGDAKGLDDDWRNKARKPAEPPE